MLWWSGVVKSSLFIVCKNTKNKWDGERFIAQSLVFIWKKVNLSQKTMFFITEERVWIKEDILERKNSITYITSRLFWFWRRKAIRLLLSTYCIFWNRFSKKPFTLHLFLGIPCVYRGFRGRRADFHPSSPFIACHFLSLKLFSVRYELTSLTFLFVILLLWICFANCR